MKATPKEVISCRFGVTLYPSRAYEIKQAEYHPNHWDVEFAPSGRVMVAKRKMKVGANWGIDPIAKLTPIVLL